MFSFGPRNTSVPPFSERRQNQVLNSAQTLASKGRYPGESSACSTRVTESMGLGLNALSRMHISNSCLLSPGFQAATSSKMQARTVPKAFSYKKKKKRPKPKTLRKLKCEDYMRFLCIIIFSLHAPSPLFLFASESSKETQQQRTWALMLAGKHPKNKATQIRGNFRTSHAKIIYQVHNRRCSGRSMGVALTQSFRLSSEPQIIPCSQIK